MRTEDLHFPVINAHKAREFQRREQQGLGKPIISTQLDEMRVVSVGSRTYWSTTWKNFHDFLRDYPRIILGDEWWFNELRKPSELRHRIVCWFIRASESMTAMRNGGHGELGLPATGALSAYMRLAYDLYSLQHAVKVEPLLIERIKNPLGFPGAIFEVRVAASLLRAGFTLELEDETDRRITHVEFVATHTKTGAKFSVEAKRREGARLKINKLLHSALTKYAEHPRVVFIDTNDARLDLHRFEKIPIALAETKNLLKQYASDPLGRTLPAAYVIATHTPEEHYLDTTDLHFSLMLWGFRVDDMQPGYKTLVEEVQIRRRHAPIFDLIESMEKHRFVPMSFDGEADAFASSPPSGRLQLGNKYIVRGLDSSDVEATLESAVVSAAQKATCIFLNNDGHRFIASIALTTIELDAYKQHPSTFFGVIDRNAGRKGLTTRIDFFNCMWESAKDTPKATLLEHMRLTPDIDALAVLSQFELATLYCAHMATVMMKKTKSPIAAA